MTLTLRRRSTRRTDAASRAWQSPRTGYLYIGPAVLMYGVFFVWPALQLGWLSLHEWSGFGPREFVGFDNYQRLLDDRVVLLALRHNLLWTAAAVVIPVTVGLLLAVLLSRSPLRGRTFFRAVYFFPQVISSISVAVAWGWIYNPSFGFLNQVLGTLGLDGLQRGWLGDQTTALPALFLAWSWIHYGFAMVIFLAALESLDETFFEAAKIDGAGPIAQFRHVLIPLIRRPLTTVLLVTVISAFQVFDIIFALTNGGPGRATMVLPLYMLDSAFTFRKIGYGATVAVLLGAIILIVSLVLLRIRRAWDD